MQPHFMLYIDQLTTTLKVHREREREREICVAELSITDQTLISPVEHIPDPYCILDSILFPRLKSYYICTSCKLDEI